MDAVNIRHIAAAMIEQCFVKKNHRVGGLCNTAAEDTRKEWWVV